MPAYIPVLTPIVTANPGPFSVSAFVKGFPDQWDPKAPRLTQRIRSALDNIPGCYRSGPDTYVYLPLFRTGARMLQPLLQGEPRIIAHLPSHPVIWLEELLVLLNPTFEQDAPVTAELEGGSTELLRVSAWRQGIRLTAGFNRWLVEQRDRGMTALEFHCLDGRQHRFSVRAVTLGLDGRHVANQALLTAARAICQPMRRDIMVHELAARLMARGVYHGTEPPAPLGVVLFQPGRAFRYTGLGVAYQPQSAALRKRLGPLISDDIDTGWFFRISGGLVAPEPDPAPEAVAAFEGSVQVKVTIYAASRTLQLDGSHSLEDLHYAIQSAFEWDDDHLWAFFPDRKDYSLAFGPEGLESECPPAHQVSLGSLVAMGVDRLLYVFDFGDNHEFQCQVTRHLPDVRTPEPLVVASRGESPSQYPEFEDEFEVEFDEDLD